jgi:hypothetical protein
VAEQKLSGANSAWEFFTTAEPKLEAALNHASGSRARIAECEMRVAVQE